MQIQYDISIKLSVQQNIYGNSTLYPHVISGENSHRLQVEIIIKKKTSAKKVTPLIYRKSHGKELK